MNRESRGREGEESSKEDGRRDGAPSPGASACHDHLAQVEKVPGCRASPAAPLLMEGILGSPNASVLGGRSLLVGSSWMAAFLCFIILLTTAGNSLLILLIVTQRSLRNTSNYFLVSLFMSDLMVGLVVMPPAMLNQLYGHWVLRGDFCSLWYAFDVMCCSASILNLCVISLDRYLLIISPLKYKLRMTSCRALWLILATWTLAALASFLPIKLGWHKLEFEVWSPNVTSRGDEEQCRLVVSLPYALVASCLTFFLPSAAISFTYCRILLAARKQAVQVASLASNVATATTDESMEQVKGCSWGGGGEMVTVSSAGAREQGRLGSPRSLNLSMGGSSVCLVPMRRVTAPERRWAPCGEEVCSGEPCICDGTGAHSPRHTPAACKQQIHRCQPSAASPVLPDKSGDLGQHPPP